MDVAGWYDTEVSDRVENRYGATKYVWGRKYKAYNAPFVRCLILITFGGYN